MTDVTRFSLRRFAELALQKVDLVRLRHFAGFTIDEDANLLGISRNV